MRQHAVVFVDVEGDQSTDGEDAVQRVQKQPLMLEGAPPRFDHGIGELQFREGQQPAQDTRVDQGINLGVHVLASAGFTARSELRRASPVSVAVVEAVPRSAQCKGDSCLLDAEISARCELAVNPEQGPASDRLGWHETQEGRRPYQIASPLKGYATIHVTVTQSPSRTEVRAICILKRSSYLEESTLMTQTTEAVYANGVLKPTRDLHLREQQRVRLIVESVDDAAEDRPEGGQSAQSWDREHAGLLERPAAYARGVA